MNKPTLGKWVQGEFTVQTYGEPIKHIYVSSDSGVHEDRTIADIGFWRDYDENEPRANANLIVTAVNQCQKVNPENPQAVADQIEAMYKILKELSVLRSLWQDHPTFHEKIMTVLNAIEKK